MSLFTQAHAFISTGAALRARAATGCPVATAEIARRAQKTPKTVAALVSRGMTDQANARIAAAKATRKPAKAAVKAPAAVFARVEPKVDVATPAKRDSLKAVRADMGAMDAKLDKVLGAVETLSRTVSSLYLR